MGAMKIKVCDLTIGATVRLPTAQSDIYREIKITNIIAKDSHLVIKGSVNDDRYLTTLTLHSSSEIEVSDATGECFISPVFPFMVSRYLENHYLPDERDESYRLPMAGATVIHRVSDAGGNITDTVIPLCTNVLTALSQHDLRACTNLTDIAWAIRTYRFVATNFCDDTVDAAIGLDDYSIRDRDYIGTDDPDTASILMILGATVSDSGENR